MSRNYRKLVIVGDAGCGKTCLLTVFAKGVFPEVYVPRIFESYVAEIDVDGKNVELALWDTVGHDEHNDHLRPLGYPNSHVFLICFAIDSPDLFNNVQEKWVLEVAHFCPGVPVLLVGCKQDLRHNPRVIEQLERTNQRLVTPEEGLAVSRVIGAERYFECSAQTGEGVQEVFNYAARAALLCPGKISKTRKCLIL